MHYFQLHMYMYIVCVCVCVCVCARSCVSVCTYVHTMLFCPCTFSAVEQMILQNPGNAKITNEYLYNLLHTGALYGRKDIVSLAIDKVNSSFIHDVFEA